VRCTPRYSARSSQAADECGREYPARRPERLEAAGISWKIYQDIGVGLDAPGFWGWTADPFIGNYGEVDGDSQFEYRFAGHVETGEDSISDPLMGGLV
jgi:phospholipase C